VWFFKVMLLLVDMLCAFIFFSQSIRLLSHVSLMISAPGVSRARLDRSRRGDVLPRRLADLMNPGRSRARGSGRRYGCER
jgi:hypothetical protein